MARQQASVLIDAILSANDRRLSIVGKVQSAIDAFKKNKVVFLVNQVILILISISLSLSV